jgi:hypothetical protein
MFVTTPYHYLVSAGDSAGAALVDELCAWHDRMVAHIRRHGVPSDSCRCGEPDECPREDAVDLWARARRAFGAGAEALAFLRQHARGSVHG